MKFSHILFFILLFSSCTNSDNRETQSKRIQDLSVITTINFNTTSHGFGELNAGEIVLYTFEFTNTGEADYQIKSIESDCGCVSTSFSSNVVKPGQTGSILVEFDTSGLAGREYKTIEIHGNSNELKHLAIFADVNNELLDIKY